MKTIVFLCVAALLAGCVHPQYRELEAWADMERERVRQGELPWSEYYKELFTRLSAAPPIAGQPETMMLVAQMIQSAELYEAGKLSQSEWDYIQRMAKAAGMATDQRIRTESAQAIGKALQDYGDRVYGPEATKARQIPIPPSLPSRAPETVNCYTGAFGSEFGVTTECTVQ